MQLKKLVSSAIIAAIFVLLLGSCNFTPPASEGFLIVTTLFPQYDYARQIVGDKAEVVLLLSPGAESHAYEPSPADVIRINSCDLFIYTGEYMEPWVGRIEDSVDNPEVVFVDTSKGIALTANDIIDGAHIHEDGEEDHGHENEEGEHGHDHDHGDEEELYDPHIWTNPLHAKVMVGNILEAVCTADEENAVFYRQNAEAYKLRLDALDGQIRSDLADRVRSELVFGSRCAFYYFIEEYGLSFSAAFDSCSEDADPGVKRITELIDKVRDDAIPVVYYEEMTSPQIANSIAEQTGARVLPLHTCHNLTRVQFDEGIGYIELMEQNLESLREGLCK